MTTSSKKRFRTALLGASALISAAALMAGSAAAADARAFEFDMPAQPLTVALKTFGATADQQLIFSEGLVRGRTAPPLKGAYTPDQALAMLLAGSGLTADRTPGGVVTIRSEADPQGGSAAGDGAEVEALIVTAQKKEEAIQDVPIAISAFSEKSLQEQKIEGGYDLLKAVPNVTFSKNNFSGYNFSIRGIGTKAISVTTDPGVAVEFNNMALIRNRLFEQEYFDVERVEVLRGPQGTLHGRNATSGVINMISAKPDMDEFKGWVKGEVGNYHAKRISAMVNVPLVEDKLAIRFAGALTQRNGFGVNLYDNSDVDNRDLWSARVTVGFNPTERIRTNLVWERFEEDDQRARTSKQLCHHDDGRTEVGGVPVPVGDGVFGEPAGKLLKAYFSQGCLPGSLYDDAAFGTPNGIALPFVMYLEQSSVYASTSCGGIFCGIIPQGTDPYGGQTQSRDLRAIYSQIKPKYRASADIVEFNMDFDLSDVLALASQTVYVTDEYYATQDYNRFTTYPTFYDTNLISRDFVAGPDYPQYHDLLPGGVFCDPQLGCSDTIVGKDLSRAKSSQFSQEIRIQSDFDGPLNFSAGVHYTRYRTTEDYYVFFNGITLAAVITNSVLAYGGLDPSKWTTNPDCSATGGIFRSPSLPDGLLCIPIEQNSIENIQDVGHNYFLSRNPYTLNSGAVFGEVYWQMRDDLKWTAGLRYTEDRKTFTPVPSQVMLTDPARLEPYVPIFGQETVDNVFRSLPLYSFASGLYPALPPIKRSWKEVTGRVGFDWKPDLSFTDQTMVYGFYSRGYKGGGMNPPRVGIDYEALAAQGIILAPSAPPEFDPEFVNAFEVGAKNTLLDGAMMLNLGAFFYDYDGYQVSKIVDRTANNENFDARVWGLELETLFAPSRNLRINASLGYLDTKLGDGSRSIDVMNRTAGRTDWVVVKPAVTMTSNCIVPVSVVSQLLENYDPSTLGNIFGFNMSSNCPGGGLFGQNFTGHPGGIGGTRPLPDGTFYDPADHPEANYGAGFYSDVSGNELPNSPHFTVSLGAQYSVEFAEGWKATLRGDGYWQSQSWARVYELPIDKLHGWYNANLSLWFERDDGLKIEVYAKNILDKTPITDTFTNSDDTALTTNVFVLDPRLIGLSIRKEF